MRGLAPLLILLLFLSACGYAGWGGQNRNQYINNERARYYQGVEGVEMRVDQLPHTLYYYGNAPGSAANEFPFGVEVWNKGASYSRGAIFISGFDPNIIQFDEIDLSTSLAGACSLRLGDYSLNKFGVILQCGDDFFLRSGRGWLDEIRVRGKPWFGQEWLDKIIVDYKRTVQNNWRLDFVFDDANFRFEQWQNGRLLIGILAGLSFMKFLGQEYLLAADNYDYPGGDLDYIEYHGRIIDWPEGVDQIPQRLLITNCYMYTTFAAPIVCIDPQPYVESRKACTARQISWSGSQGAPVAITRVVQENTPRKAVFHITVENVGGGTVFDPGDLEKCSPYFPGGARSNDLNQIWIGYVRIGDYELSCTPETSVRLYNGRAEFTCTYPIEYAELNSAYETPLVIELWYGYSKVMERPILLKRVT